MLDGSERMCSENCHSCGKKAFQGSISFITSISADSIATEECRLLFYDRLSGNSVLTAPFEVFPSGISAEDVPASIVTTKMNQGSSILIKFTDRGSQILSSYFGSNVSMTIENCGSAVFASCGSSLQISSTTCTQLSAPFWSEENVGITDAVQAVATFLNFSLSADAKIDGSCVLKFVAHSIVSPTRLISTNSTFLLYASSLISSSIVLVTTGQPISFQLEWRDNSQKLNSLNSSRALISLSYCGNASVDCGSSRHLSQTSCLALSELGSSSVTGFIIRGDATLNCRLTFTVLEYSEQVFTYQDFEVRASNFFVDTFPSIIRVGQRYSFLSSATDDNFVRLLSLYGVNVKFKLVSCGSGSFDSCGTNARSNIEIVFLFHMFHRLCYGFC